MVVQEFLERMSKMDLLSHVGLEDIWDRLNFSFTVIILMIMSTITTVKTYVMTPVICYLPNIVGSHEGQASYVNNYCFTVGMYDVELSEFKIGNNINSDWKKVYESNRVYTYQWLPLFIGVQGILCYLPKIVWLLFANNRTGIDLSNIVKTANEAQRADGDKREKLIRHVSKQLQLWRHNCRKLKNNSIHRKAAIFRLHSICSKRDGNWLACFYIFVKFLYLANSLFQLLMMCSMLQLKRTSRFAKVSSLSQAATFGVKLLYEMIHMSDWMNTKAFPRKACCAIETRQAAGTNYIFSQCVLPVNMLLEKCYIILWFWFIFLCFTNAMSIILWIWRITFPFGRKKNVKKLLFLAEKKDNKLSMNHVKDFITGYLKCDGCFVVQMISLNCGEVVTADLCHDLYKNFLLECKAQKQTTEIRDQISEDDEAGEKAIADTGMDDTVSNQQLLLNNFGSNNNLSDKPRKSNRCNHKTKVQIEDEKVKPSAPPAHRSKHSSASSSTVLAS